MHAPVSWQAVSRYDDVRAGIAWAHQGLAETALASGKLTDAASHFIGALVRFRDLGDRMGISWCLAGFAAMAARANQQPRAARFWGAAEVLRQSIGARHAPAVRATHERLMAATRAQLGETTFQEWAQRGAEMQMRDAIELALASSRENHMPDLDGKYGKIDPFHV